MAVTSMMQRLLDNALTAKFAKSLKHSDLPEGWADNPEIVQLAEDAYSVMGTESPWFKAWFGNSKVVDEAGKPVYGYHKTDAETPIEVFKTDNGYGYGGAFFNDVESVANGFGRNPNGKTYEVFLNLRDPLEVNANAALYYNIERPVWMPGRGTADTVEIANFGRNIKKDGAIIRDVVEPTGFGTDYIAFDPTSIKSTSNRGTFNPADPNIYKGLIPAVGAGGLLSLMGAEEAEAKPYQFPADKRGTVLYEPGLESPIVDPADILTAPFGVAGAGAKAAAMAAEPFISYGMDKAINGLLGLFSDEEE